MSRLEREYQPEHSANATRILTRQITTVCSRVAAGNRQPEPRAARVVRPTMIKSYQSLEDPHPLRRRHARTRVPDFGNCDLIMFANGHMDLALRPSRSHGVVDHIPQNAADPGGIGSGYDLWSAHGHSRFRMQQSYPINLAVHQRSQ